MQLNKLGSGGSGRQKAKRVGRGMGSGLGKTCGRGHKGQKSRSGGRVKAGFEGGQMPLQMRLPKFGFTSRKAAITTEVRLDELEKLDADVIDLDVLKQADIVQRGMLRAKVIASGKITRKVELKGLGVTKGARAAIESAGGSIGD